MTKEQKNVIEDFEWEQNLKDAFLKKTIKEKSLVKFKYILQMISYSITPLHYN